MGWYYYLEDRLRFPFQARCIAANVVSRLRKGKTVEVRSIAPEDACQSDMLVLICWQGRSLAVPYLNWPPLAGTYQPPRPSLIGIRWRKVTVSELRCLVPTYPGLPEGHCVPQPLFLEITHAVVVTIETRNQSQSSTRSRFPRRGSPQPRPWR